ncbi:MAG: lipopolysaccharide biosynthesis protein [Bacteroidaceae bacterium]|nr:lipopolysaccharide biosynthesis protein [Bacteroidaceae bacterium]
MASLKKEITNGVFWIAIAKYSGIVVQLLITAVLARHISPAAFGTIAVAMVVLHFLNILADIGIGPAVVQYKQLTKLHLDSLFTLTIYIGIVLSLALYFSSGVISVYYEDNILKRVCQMMVAVIFFNALNVVPNALMRKDKRFRTIALRTLFFQVISGAIAVWGSLNGWGIYALLVSPILTAVGVFCVNYWHYPLRFVFRMDSGAVNTVASFSTFQFAFSFFNYFSRNLDKLIIGKYFSMTQLGYYDKSYHLMMLPLQNVTFVIEPVLHPILSSLQNNKSELGEKNRKLAVIISNISFPIGLILFFCGGEIIRIVYGGQWDAAIPVFRILALSLPLQMILSTIGSIYQAAGNTKHMFLSGILNTFCTVSGFFIAAHWGDAIESMAWAWNITLCINFLNSYFIIHAFTLKISSKSFYRALVPQIINSVIVFLIIFFISEYLNDMELIVRLLVKFLFVISLSLMLGTIFGQYDFRGLFKVLKKYKQ